MKFLIKIIYITLISISLSVIVEPIIDNSAYAQQGGGNKGGGNNGGGNTKGDIENYYLSGVEYAGTLLSFTTSLDAYVAYQGLIMRRCATLSNLDTGAVVYAVGDPRLGYGVCAFTLGVKDGFFGSSSDYTVCETEYEVDTGFEANIERRQGNQDCLSSYINPNDNPNMPIYFCPQKTETLKFFNNRMDATFNLPGGTHREGVVGYVLAEEHGDTCGLPGYQIYCSATFICAKQNPNGNSPVLRWRLEEDFDINKSCTCIPASDTECLGTAPSNKPYCKCGKWATFQDFNSNAPCL